jgi:hypothetical protein
MLPVPELFKDHIIHFDATVSSPVRERATVLITGAPKNLLVYAGIWSPPPTNLA